MTYVFIAHGPEDHDFAEKLSQDLETAGVEHWRNEDANDDELAALNEATHLVAVLSPQAVLNDSFLGALQFARQHQLARIALRVAELDALPPQLQGILPLDCTDEAAYQDSLQTLLEDLQIESSALAPELPEELMTALYSDTAEIRKRAIHELAVYANADEELRALARDELNALVFRERESGLRVLLRTTMQYFDTADRPLEPDVALPSKEELAQRAEAEGKSVIIEQSPPTMHFWETNRWHVVLAGLGLLVGAVAAVIAGHWGYLGPVLLVGLILPHLNIVIRQGGAFEWRMPGAAIGNGVLGLLVAGIVGLILMLARDALATGFLIASLLLGAALGVFIGWLSSVEIEVPSS